MWKVYAVKQAFRTYVTGNPIKVDDDYQDDYDLIEERIITLKARSFDEAIRKAEKEASNYCEDNDHLNPYGQKVSMRYMGSVDAFDPFDQLAANLEVFSSTMLYQRNLSDSEICDMLFGPKNKNRNNRKVFLNENFSGRVYEE